MWGGSGKDAVSLLRDNRGLGSCLWYNKGTSLLLVLFILVFSFYTACVSGYLKGRMDQMCIGLTIETFQLSASRALPVFYRQEKYKWRKFNMTLFVFQVCCGYFRTTESEYIKRKQYFFRIKWICSASAMLVSGFFILCLWGAEHTPLLLWEF